MDFTAFLLLLGLTMTACSSPPCDRPCKRADRWHEQDFKHLSSDLRRSSVAPWTMGNSSEGDRMPQTIHFAVCKTCSVENMVAKPIFLEVSVFRRVGSGAGGWCRCPYKLAVGCTCVDKQ